MVFVIKAFVCVYVCFGCAVCCAGSFTGLSSACVCLVTYTAASGAMSVRCWRFVYDVLLLLIVGAATVGTAQGLRIEVYEREGMTRN